MLPLIPAALICLISPQGQQTPDAKERLSEAIKANDWASVYRLGQPLLIQSKAPENDQERRTLGIVWFAAFSETQAGRAKENTILCLEKSTRLIPGEPLPWYYLGAQFNQLGQHNKALEALDHYLSLRPDEPHGNYEKGFALNALDRAEEALSALQTAVRNKPEDAGFRVELAFSLNHLKRPKEALPHLEKAITLQPKLSAYMELSWTYRLLDRWEEALVAIERAEKLGMDPQVATEQRELIRRKQVTSAETKTEEDIKAKGKP